MSDSDYSLDNFEDEEDVPLSQSKKPRDGSDYRIKGALKVPHIVSYTAQSLFEQMHSGDIDLNAEYQRGVVWPDAKQIGLIDSFFRNYFVPPIVFVVKREDDGAEKRVCIDGKQRLTSIWRFMDGLIPYKDPFTGERFTFKDRGKTKSGTKLLPERYRKIFRNKQIACMEYDQLSDDDEREIFQRVQLGMALTPAEKMQAINSPNASFIRDLSMEYVAEGLGDLLEWDTSRGSDFRALTTAVYAMQKWKSLTTSPSLPQLNALLQSNEELEEPFCIKIRQTLAIFVALAKDSRYQAAFHIPNVKKVAPVEFMTTCVLIASFKDKLTMSQLSEAILEMRKDVRGVEQDIRMNGRVVKHMMGFIKGLKSASLKPDPGQPLASNVVRGAGKKRSKIEEEKEEEVSQKKIKLSIPRPKLLSQGVSSTQPLSTTKSSSPAVGSRTKEESSQPLNRQLGSLPRSTQSTASSFRPSFTEVKPTVSDASESLVQTHSKPLLNRLDVIKAAKGNSSGPSFSRTSISSERLESSPIYSADTETQSLGVALIDRISKPAGDSLNHYQQNLVDTSSRHGIESVTRDSSWKGNRKR